MRTTMTSLAVAGLLVFTVGCGSSGSDEDATTTTTEPPAVGVDEWAEGFCADFSTWLTDLDDARSAVGEGLAAEDYEGARDAVAEVFGVASDRTTELIEKIESGPIPDSEEGQAVVDDVAAGFGDFVKALDQAQADTKAMVVDPKTFEDDVEALSKQFTDGLDEVKTSLAQIDQDHPDTELNAAVKESCDF